MYKMYFVPLRSKLPIMGTKKNPHAVALGRKGGKARAANLTKEELSEQGRKAVMARWARNKKKWPA
jgi:hypothetical protein